MSWKKYLSCTMGDNSTVVILSGKRNCFQTGPWQVPNYSLYPDVYVGTSNVERYGSNIILWIWTKVTQALLLFPAEFHTEKQENDTHFEFKFYKCIQIPKLGY